MAFGVALAMSGSAAAETFTHGYWQGKPLYGRDGQFERCSMIAAYKSGHRLLFDVDRKISWRMWIGNPSWQLTPKTKFEGVIVVDRGALIPVTGEVIDPDLVVIPLATTAHVVDNMRRGRVMELVVGQARIPFALDGTAQAIPRLVQCVTAISGNPNRPSGTASTDQFRTLTNAENMIPLVNLLNHAGAIGYQLEPALPNDPAARVKMADGARGYLFAAVGSRTKNADDYASDAIGRMSKSCKGEFISGKQPVATDDGTVVRKVVGTCRVGNDAEAVESTIIRRADGFLMEFTLSVPSSLGLAGDEHVKTRSAITEAALKSQ
jgi:hypothetical protein